jgi:hypothetical protein
MTTTITTDPRREAMQEFRGLVLCVIGAREHFSRLMRLAPKGRISCWDWRQITKALRPLGQPLHEAVNVLEDECGSAAYELVLDLQPERQACRCGCPGH